jgi:hypothetical protein
MVHSFRLDGLKRTVALLWDIQQRLEAHMTPARYDSHLPASESIADAGHRPSQVISRRWSLLPWIVE